MSVDRKEVIIDAGFMVGILHQQDPHHVNARRWDFSYGQEHELITTELVIHEIFWLLKNRVSHQQAVAFTEMVDEEIKLISLPADWHRSAVPILKKFSNLKLDLADVSLVVLAGQVGHGRILTVDVRDFSLLTWGNGKKPFNNLLYPHH